MNSIQLVRNKVETNLTDTTGVFTDIFEHLKLSQGKYARTQLGLLCCESELKDKTVDLLAAIEILHLSTLVHDDVIDNAPMRRGMPSVPAVFGSKKAVLSGDYLFTICFKILADHNTEKIKDFSKALSNVCKGEIIQLKNNFNLELSIKDYLKTISGKTAALFSMAAVAGAGNEDYTEEELRSFAKVGYRLGMLFQITDDYLDYEGTSEEVGKTTCKDLLEGVITLPLIFAIKTKPEIKALIKDSALTTKEVAQIYSLVIESGGLSEAKGFTEKYYKKTLKEIERLPKGANKTSLIEYLDKIMNRGK